MIKKSQVPVSANFDEKSYLFEKLCQGFSHGFLTAPILYPEFVTISSHGPDSVYVEWRGVSTGLYEETLWGYKVCFFVWRVPYGHRILSNGSAILSFSHQRSCNASLYHDLW